MPNQKSEDQQERPWSQEELVEVGKRQRRVIGAILLGVVAAALALYAPILSFFASLFVAVMVHDLARILRSQRPGAYFLCSLLPFINIIVLLSVSSAATAVLREHDVQVGFFGVKKADLDRLTTPHSTPK